MMNKSRTDLHFRVDREELEKLEQIAVQNKINTKALLGQIVKSYIEWERFAPNIGIVPIQKEKLTGFFEVVGDDALAEIAVKAADRFMDKLLILTGKGTLDSFLHIARITLKKSGFSISESVEDGELQWVVRHGMGRKCSIFYSTYNQRIVKNLGYASKIEVRDDLWIIRIHRSKLPARSG